MILRLAKVKSFFVNTCILSCMWYYFGATAMSVYAASVSEVQGGHHHHHHATQSNQLKPPAVAIVQRR